MLAWIYGSGFPKSLDISKAIDKAAGAVREPGIEGRYSARRPKDIVQTNIGTFHGTLGASKSALVTQPATPEAATWQGWGTALKPAYEPIIIAYKPIKEKQTMQLNLEAAIVYHGNNLDILPTLPDNSVDSIVTDPPYELGFMGKKWDSTGIAYSVELWEQCLRVLKPGGHLLAFGGTRTFHRIAVAIEDAGFEIRDSIAWMYGSGFPKSLDISKAIDKAAGAEREAVIEKTEDLFGEREEKKKIAQPGSTADRLAMGNGWQESPIITAPATPEAEKWQGWGTALKPAFEPIIVARKPLIGTVAENVLQYGTGGLNIDGSRIGTELAGWQGAGRSGETATAGASRGGNQGGYNFADGKPRPVQGRWPANLILDEYTAELLDEQSGVSKSPQTYKRNADGFGQTSYGLGEATGTESLNYGDSGGASRFFYIAKASKRDRNEGLEGSNQHPTVKPTQLMRYLVKLVTPPGGIVLDPFTGSGSTGKAAILEGFDFIGIELTEEYLPIIEGRLKHAIKTRAEEEGKEEEMLF